MGVQNHGAYKALSQITGELKIVIIQTVQPANKDTLVCEVDNVKQQIMSTRRADISKCPSVSQANGAVNLYVVEAAVTSDYKSKNLTLFNNTAFSGGSGQYALALAEMNDPVCAQADNNGDPLLIQLKAQPIALTPVEKGVMFDLLGMRNDYQKVRTSWFADASSENYFLVLPDESGAVDGIDQLFGDNTLGPDKKFAKQGFAALAKYDDNKDQMIDGDDEVYPKLRLWKDANLDGIVQPDELFSLADKGVMLIDLRFDRRFIEKDAYGNITKFRSVVVMKDGSHMMIYDLFLGYKK
jgi:hypothetical protein